MQQLQTLDYIVFLAYFFMVAGYGFWIYNRKRSESMGSNDYFLAEGSLTWWAIGASLIASNISAEQFIGMSGSGFKMGLAISTYEWMAAATLIVVAVFFMPVYLKNKIFTMPQFLSKRYNSTVSLVMAVFWLALYILVNLTAIIYLGSLAVSGISGFSFQACAIALAVFAIIITLGGMKVIGYTDVIQVIFLIIGGLVTTCIAIKLVSGGTGLEGIMAGLSAMQSEAGEHFHMILQPGQNTFMEDNVKKDAYMELPGLAVLFGGMWIANLNYWGCNQYITQRALGADLPTARKGILFAAFLKLLMPVIVVLPGIACYVLHQRGMFTEEMLNEKRVLTFDKAYPVLLNLLDPGFKGLSFAALTAAIVASLAGKANSIATIFTLDIYKNYINKDASEKQLVWIGRLTVVVAMLLGVGVILTDYFASIMNQGGFSFIQQMTGLLSPGIFATFIMGFFWKRTNSAGALVAIVGGFLMSLYMHFYMDYMPFLDRMGWVFVCCVTVMVILGFVMKDEEKGLEIDSSMFKVDRGFAIGAGVVLTILVALYSVFW